MNRKNEYNQHTSNIRKPGDVGNILHTTKFA
jgi:hypothetical protein